MPLLVVHVVAPPRAAQLHAAEVVAVDGHAVVPALQVAAYAVAQGVLRARLQHTRVDVEECLPRGVLGVVAPLADVRYPHAPSVAADRQLHPAGLGRAALVRVGRPVAHPSICAGQHVAAAYDHAAGVGEHRHRHAVEHGPGRVAQLGHHRSGPVGELHRHRHRRRPLAAAEADVLPLALHADVVRPRAHAGAAAVTRYCVTVTDCAASVPSKLRLTTGGTASSEYDTAAAPSSPSAPGLTL